MGARERIYYSMLCMYMYCYTKAIQLIFNELSL